MKLNEFEIGGFFWTGSGKWKCIDVATKHVIAVKWEKVKTELTISDGKSKKKKFVTLDPNKDSVHYFAMTVFSAYDFDGCWATEKEYKDLAP